MKHEVFILGQSIDQKARDGTEAGGNEERERIEKGSRDSLAGQTLSGNLLLHVPGRNRY